MKRFWIWLFILSLGGLVVAQSEPETLTLVTHDSFAISDEALEAFQSITGIQLEVLRLGDAGQLVNQSVLSAGNPLGDVLFGVDNTFLSRALDAEIFVPYESPNLDFVDPQFILEGDFSVTPIDYGDVCLNYDIAYFEEQNIPLPESLLDLTMPAYRGLLVVENAATSSPGLAFLLATIAEFGVPSEDSDDYSYLDYWQALVDNDTLIVDDWSTAYFQYFTQGSEEGSYPLVVSYASSPPFTYSEETELASTASIVADGMCFRQVEYAGILRGTENEELARLLIDFMLSETFQADVPFQMYVFPVHTEVELPELFADYAQLPEVPAQLASEDIEANRDLWITSWLEVVTR